MTTTALSKYKDLALKVIYYTKKRQLGQKVFFATSKFQDVLLYFEQNLKDRQTFLKPCYFLNGRQVFPSDILLYYCTIDPNLRIIEENMTLEIEELENIDDASEPIYEKLFKPVINPFKLIVLNNKEGLLQKVDFSEEKIKEFNLDTINEKYACCNSTDSFFISCEKNFWVFSHNNFEIQKFEMPYHKENHSMTYVLSKNIIFIAGGSENSFYYDINSKEFIDWGKTEGISNKPALIEFGEYLYLFNSFRKTGIFFERTKLTNPAKVWEKLIPQSGDKDSRFFYSQSFGVSKCTGGNILFAGGINNQLRTFVYNPIINVLFMNAGKDESVKLSERNFYKIDHNFNIAIPANIENDGIIAIVNKNAKSLNLVTFPKIGLKTRNLILQIDNIRNRLPGNITIQCNYMTIKDYENLIKQREMEKQNLNNNENKNKDGKKLFGGKLGANTTYKNFLKTKTLINLEKINEGK